MRKLFIMPLALCFLMVSCSDNKPKERATELCDCLKKDGLTEKSTEKDMDKISKNAEKNMLQYIGVLADIQKDMKELDNDARPDYIKAFMKELIDTDCMGIVLKAIPYDDLLKQDMKNLAGGGIDSHSIGSENDCGEYEITFEGDKEINCDGPGCDCRDENGSVQMFKNETISGGGGADAVSAGESSATVDASEELFL